MGKSSPTPHPTYPSIYLALMAPTGLTNTTFSELIQIDSNYLSRLALRKQIIRDHHEIAIQADPSITPAVNELYTWLVGSYLPTRFPTLFTLSPTTSPISVLNHATSLSLPVTPPSDPIKVLEILGSNLEEDFLLLLPSEDGDGYKLRGYVTCFPAGFNTLEKFGKKLREIHAPVPGYKEKLEKSMDRFFDRLEVGKVVLRSNWSITTHDRLYAASGGNHLYEGEVPEEVVDISNVSRPDLSLDSCLTANRPSSDASDKLSTASHKPKRSSSRSRLTCILSLILRRRGRVRSLRWLLKAWNRGVCRR
jgi:hypothetical protein